MEKKLRAMYKDVLLECPRCNKYFSLDQLVMILERKGVQKETIKSIFEDLVLTEANVYPRNG